MRQFPVMWKEGFNFRKAQEYFDQQRSITGSSEIQVGILGTLIWGWGDLLNSLFGWGKCV